MSLSQTDSPIWQDAALVQRARDVGAQFADKVIETARVIAMVAAPTNDERDRAVLVADLFQTHGATDVSIDSIHDVVGRLKGVSAEKALLLAAHTDTVFSRETALKIHQDDQRAYGPGLGDNSLGVASVVLLPDMLQALGATPATDIVLTGLRRSNAINIVIVSITMGALALFVITGLPALFEAGGENLSPLFNPDGNPVANLLHATALMFVAYTGYGRIATMGEEVREPRRVIPRAIIAAMILTMIIYMSVAVVGVGAVGTDVLAGTAQTQAAPLEIAAEQFGSPLTARVVAVGAITAMLGVLLNLILGLSRILLAMGRRGDMPEATARIDPSGSTPYVAVVIIGVAIAGLVLIGNVKTTWSFSAFSVLIYYAITNLSALRLSDEERLFPKWLAWGGLAACLFLAFWVEIQIWLVGLALIAAGLVWHAIARNLSGHKKGSA